MFEKQDYVRVVEGKYKDKTGTIYSECIGQIGWYKVLIRDSAGRQQQKTVCGKDLVKIKVQR